MAENSDRIRFDDQIEPPAISKSRSRSQDLSQRSGSQGPSQRAVYVGEKETDSVFDDEVPAVEERDFKHKQVDTFFPCVAQTLLICHRHSAVGLCSGMFNTSHCTGRMTKSSQARISIDWSHLRRHWHKSSLRLFIYLLFRAKL